MTKNKSEKNSNEQQMFVNNTVCIGIFRGYVGTQVSN